MLRVECRKCARKGRYQVHKLIAKYGRNGNMMKWREQLNGDCLRRDARSIQERLDLICPDLPTGDAMINEFMVFVVYEHLAGAAARLLSQAKRTSTITVL